MNYEISGLTQSHNKLLNFYIFWREMEQKLQCYQNIWKEIRVFQSKWNIFKKWNRIDCLGYQNTENVQLKTLSII